MTFSPNYECNVEMNFRNMVCGNATLIWLIQHRALTVSKRCFMRKERKLPQ